MASLRPLDCSSRFSLARKLHSAAPRGSTVGALKNSRALPQQKQQQQQQELSRRRFGVLVSLLLAAPSEHLTAVAAEAADAYEQYEDEVFKLDVPKGWIKGEGKASSSRKVIAFHPQDDTSASVNVLITVLRSDFTSLGSFGSADAFASNLVGSMDRSRNNPPGMTAKLLDASSKNGLYFAEYVTQSPGETQRHLMSAVGVSKGEFYNRLLSVTAQYMERDADKYKAVLEQTVGSFRVKAT